MSIFLLCLTNLLIYGRTLSYGLVIDDIEWYKQWHFWETRYRKDMRWHNWIHPHTIRTRLYGAGTFGLNTRLDHALTVALHIITVLLVFKTGGLTAALLFSIHPCNHQTAIWLTGRRYSILNIVFLTLLITHTLYLLILVCLLIGRHYHASIKNRINKSIPQGTITPLTVFNTIRYSIIRLLGINQYAFLYPYTNTAPFLPCTQPVAERYLSIPLIIFCLTISKIPFILVIWPLYAFRTLQLMPMYVNIQYFYDYHKKLFPLLPKLLLLKKLYHSSLDRS